MVEELNRQSRDLRIASAKLTVKSITLRAMSKAIKGVQQRVTKKY